MLSAVLFLSLAVAPEPPALTDAQLETMAAPIRSGDARARLEAARKIAALGPEAYGALVRRLRKPLATRPEIFRKLFLEMWAQVPNWKSGDPMWIRKPDPPWHPPPRVKGQPRPKRPPRHDPEALDWLAALDAVDLDAAAHLDAEALIPPPFGQKPKPAAPATGAPQPGTPVTGAPQPGTPATGAPQPGTSATGAPQPVAPQPGTPVTGAPQPVAPQPPPPPPVPSAAEMQTARAEAMETVALLRGIANAHRLDGVGPIFDFAFTHDGVFRDECGRQIRAMDGYAVPALIRLMHRPSTRQHPFHKQRRYASYQLDRMDRQRPQKAIASAPDDLVRAEIIHAYGESRALDAVEAVLNQVDSPSHRVRKAARWTWLRYVRGKAPPPAPMRKRKLPGGKEEAQEKPDYLTYREIATLALQKQLQAIDDAPPPVGATAAQMTDELFAYYDRKRAAEWDEEFAAARALEARGDLKGATDAFGWILAHDPNYARRGEMAHAFAGYADRLRAQGQIARALGYWRQAIDLAPSGPEARRAAARVALYDGLQALAHGDADVGAFRRALALDPSLTEARAALSRAKWRLFGRRALHAVELALGFLGLGALLWLLWRKSTVDRPRPTVDGQDQG